MYVYFPLAKCTSCAEEGVRDVGGVVNADADADDEQRARDRVHGDVCNSDITISTKSSHRNS